MYNMCQKRDCCAAELVSQPAPLVMAIHLACEYDSSAWRRTVRHCEEDQRVDMTSLGTAPLVAGADAASFLSARKVSSLGAKESVDSFFASQAWVKFVLGTPSPAPHLSASGNGAAQLAKTCISEAMPLGMSKAASHQVIAQGDADGFMMACKLHV